MEVLRVVGQLFENHAPESLMALFGAVTSMLLFYLIWMILKHFFGLVTRSEVQEADLEQTSAVLMGSLVEALVLEATHLRQSLDGILHESLRCNEQNAQALAVLLVRMDKVSTEFLERLKPEFDALHQAIQEAEIRIVSTVEHGTVGRLENKPAVAAVIDVSTEVGLAEKGFE